MNTINYAPDLSQTRPLSLPPLVLIGASAGGPQILGDILKLFPRPSNFAVIIAQHLECDFMGDFVNWLSRHSGQDCSLAMENEQPMANRIYLANCHNHLTFDRMGRFIYTDQDCDDSTPYKPSIDRLFLSAAQWLETTGIAVVLTGMGSDGAKGLLQLKEKGWKTIAQDEETSLVYGMPKAAAEINAAMEILSPKKIVEFIVNSSKDDK